MDNINHIHINDDIGIGSGSAGYIKYMLGSFDNSLPLHIHLKSLGGSLYSALDVFDELSKYKGQKTAIYSGLCASATTVIASACDVILCNELGTGILVHNALKGIDVFGYMNPKDLDKLIKELKGEKKNLEVLSLMVAKIYASRSGKDIKELLKLMSEDRWMLPEEAKEYGFIDDIIKSESTKDSVSIEDKINAFEIVNKVKLPRQFKSNSNKSTTNNNDMNIKETIKNFFASDENEQVLKDETIEKLGTVLQNEIETKFSEFEQKLEAIEAKDTNTKPLEIANSVKETATDLTNRIKTIEERDSSIANVLQGFVNGVNEKIEAALKEQDERLKNTITELQLKENAIVTGDKTFEGGTPSTESWIKQLENQF